MTAEDDLLGIVGKVLVDIEDIKGHFPRTIAEQKNDIAAGAGDFEFRPLTEEEKKEFLNSLNDEGKRILTELGPRRNLHALPPRDVSEGP